MSSNGPPRKFTISRRQIHVRGVVQGVGFRPFVYNLAQGLGLSGYVLNSSASVTIEVEGESGELDRFVSRLGQEAPPLAHIEDVAVTLLDPAGYSGFVIRDSRDEPGRLVPVSPDIGTCHDCMRDFRSPENRRYGYAFTNCTNCGPRYTITRKIPYDRPRDRRFHAQPNACSECGPSLAFVAVEDLEAAPAFPQAGASFAAIGEVRRPLRDGRIVAIKGLGGFHLACDPMNDAAVRMLRERKKRSDKPFALMAPDVASANRFCIVSEADRRALMSSRRPIVILPRRPDAPLSPALAREQHARHHAAVHAAALFAL